MNLKFLISFCFLILTVECQQNESCKKSDPQLNECLKDFFNGLFRSITKKDVYRLNNTDVSLNQGPINIKANSRNILIRGIGNSTVTDIKNDLKNLRFGMKIKTPKIDIKGFYQSQGEIFSIPADTKGKFYMRAEGITQILKIQLSKVERDGQQFLKIDNIDHDFNIKGARIKLEEELQKDFQDVLQELFNTNALFFVSQFKDQISGIIVQVMQDLIQQKFDEVPENSIFPN